MLHNFLVDEVVHEAVYACCAINSCSRAIRVYHDRKYPFTLHLGLPTG